MTRLCEHSHDGCPVPPLWPVPSGRSTSWWLPLSSGCGGGPHLWRSHGRMMQRRLPAYLPSSRGCSGWHCRSSSPVSWLLCLSVFHSPGHQAQHHVSSPLSQVSGELFSCPLPRDLRTPRFRFWRQDHTPPSHSVVWMFLHHHRRGRWCSGSHVCPPTCPRSPQPRPHPCLQGCPCNSHYTHWSAPQTNCQTRVCLPQGEPSHWCKSGSRGTSLRSPARVKW